MCRENVVIVTTLVDLSEELSNRRDEITRLFGEVEGATCGAKGR